MGFMLRPQDTTPRPIYVVCQTCAGPKNNPHRRWCDDCNPEEDTMTIREERMFDAAQVAAHKRRQRADQLLRIAAMNYAYASEDNDEREIRKALEELRKCAADYAKEGP